MKRSIPWFRNALLVGAVAATGLATARAQSLPGTLSGAYTVNGTGTAFNGGNSTLSGTVTLSPAFFVDYLLVGGGGGGFGGSSGGGGGGGGVVAGSLQLNISSTSALTTGNGGTANSGGIGTAGGNTTFGGTTAYGGGASGRGVAASNGGSGGGSDSGGGVPNGTYFASGTAIYGGQGFNGGRGYSVFSGSANYPGGGGGGAGGAGQDATLDVSGNGGIGRESFITGSSVYYGGGGGGGGQTRGTAGTGGLGGGGDGSILANGSAGTNGLGGGGGGAGFNGTAKSGGAGGSGVVVLRYAGPDSATGGTESSYTADGRTYRVNQFTAVGSGSFVLAFDSNNFDAVLPGVLSGAGALAWAGPGKLTLGGSNTFTGDTLLSAGILQLGHGQALGRSTFTGGSGTVSFGGLTAATFGGLSGNSNLALSNTSASAVALSVGANDQSTSYSGVLSGAGGLTKTGTGDLTLAAANSYGGATTISAGRLAIGSGGAINSSSGVTVNGAGAELKYNSATALTSPLTLTQGILSGTGAINTAVTVGANAIIAPGNSPGIQTYSSSVWGQGGTYQWELNALTGTPGSNWDQVQVTNTLDLSGLATTNSSTKFNLDIITLTGTTPGPLNFVSGPTYVFPFASFGLLSVPIEFTTGSNSDLTSLFNISLSNWQGTQPNQSDISVKVNDAGTGLNLVIVPEPAAIAMAGLGIAVVVGTLRRRRRTA